MENHIIDAVLTFLGITGTGVAGYAIRAIVKYIINRHIQMLALQAVHYAEDVYKAGGGDLKLKHACDWLSRMLKRHHIKVDEAEIEGAVRAAYTIFIKTAEKELKKDA